MTAVPKPKSVMPTTGGELADVKAWLFAEPDDTVHSFDIFDTAVTRVWRAPSDLFLALGREASVRGLTTLEPTAFAEARHAAEKTARSRSTSGETNLGEIYAAFTGAVGLPADGAKQIAAVEVALEMRSIRPIAPVARIIEELVAAGRQVAMTSDTYFSTAEAGSILAAAGIDPNRLAFILSSEHQASKRKADVYPAVQALGSGGATHFGDRRMADFENARSAGLDARQFAGEAETAREAILAAGRWSDGLAASAAAGSARSARLMGTADETDLATFRAVGAGVAGPVLTAYVGWVLQSAERAGIDHLLFLARDGQVLHALARLIGPALGSKVACHYSYASRQALYLPAVRAVGDPVWTWLAAKMEGRSASQVLRRFGLDASVLAETGSAGGMKAETLLDAEGARRLAAMLATPPLAASIIARAAERRAVARRYYEAEAPAGSRVAIVDMGWKGRLQYCLERILDEEGATPVTFDGYYFALDRTATIPVRGIRAAFTEYRKLPNTVLLECLTQADHGSLLGFESGPDGASPVLAPTKDGTLSIVGELQAATVAFTSNFLAACEIGRVDAAVALTDLKDPALAAYRDFIEAPSLAEAAGFGALEHSDDQAHQAASQVAPVLNTADLWSLLRHGPSRPGRRLTYWPEASLRRAAAANVVMRQAAKVIQPARILAGKSMALARQAKRRVLGCKGARPIADRRPTNAVSRTGRD